MAFVVEDGSGLELANAYETLEEFKEHHDDRGVDYSAFTDPQIQVGLVKAADYVDKRFGRRFRGCKLSRVQGLEWPRTSAYTDDDYLFSGVPVVLKKAIAEYAMIVLQLGRDLAPMPAPDFGIQDPATGEVSNDSSGKIIEKIEEVGPIKESTTYAEGNSTGKPMVGTGNLSQQIPEYPQADLWIEELITSYTSRELSRG